MSSGGKTLALGCMIVCIGGLLALVLILAASMFFARKYQRIGMSHQEMTAQQQAQMAAAKARSEHPSGTANLTFGPVVERVIQAREAGTNLFLNLDTGELLTPPASVIEALGNNDRHWQGLEIQSESRPYQYVAWLKQSGADLMLQVSKVVLGFDGCFMLAHGTNSADWDNWDGITPEQTVYVGDYIAWSRRLQKNMKSKEPPPEHVNGAPYNMRQAQQQSSSESGAPVVSVLTPQQSVTYYFRTREGASGLLQITGFTDNPRGVKIRYKLVQPVGVPTAFATSGDAAVHWTDHLRLNQVADIGGGGISRYGDDDFNYEALFNPKTCTLTISYRKRSGAEYRVQIEEKGGSRRALEDTLLTTTRSKWNYQDVEQKMILDRSQFDRIAAFVLQKQTNAPPVGRLGFTPVMERPVEVFSPPQGYWFDLEIGQSVPSSKMPEDTELAVFTEWLKQSGVDFRVIEEADRRGQTRRGLDAGATGCLLVPANQADWDSRSANQLPPWPEHFTNRVTTPWLVSRSELPATLYFKTHTGAEGLLQITSFTESPMGVKIRYKLVQNNSVAKANPAASSAQLAEPPKLQFLEWDEAWKTNHPGGVHRPGGTLLTNKQELGWLRSVYPDSISDVSGQPKLSVREPRFLHLWFSHPLFDETCFTKVTLLDERGQNSTDEFSVRTHKMFKPDPQSGNIHWLIESLMCGERTNQPHQITVRLDYTVGPLEQLQAFTPDFNGQMALNGGGMLNGIGQDAKGWSFVAVAVNPAMIRSRHYGMVALTKDGRELTSGGGVSGNSDGTGVQVAKFYFNVPLSDIAEFRIGSRPIRTVEWKDVVLPGGSGKEPATNAPQASKFARVETITIAADGALTVAGEPCPVAQLAERVKQLAARQPELVEIRADNKAAMKWVVTVMDACKAAGLRCNLGSVKSVPPFTARLPVGEVELLGVSQFQKCGDPSLGVTHEQRAGLQKTWWRPDGAPLTKEIPCITGSLNQRGRDIYEIALRVRGQTNGVAGIEIESITNSGAYPAGLAGANWAQRPEDMIFWGVLSCEPGLAQTGIRIGVATEPCQTQGKFDFSSGASAGGEAGNIMLSVTSAGEETTVTCQYTQRPGWQTRLIALGPKGEVEPVRSGPFQGVAGAISETRVFRTADIKEAKLHLQRRPYRWVEFHNISLKSGQRTQVEVVGEPNQR